jgi:glycerophosphoryl diester phosphodiesterase
MHTLPIRARWLSWRGLLIVLFLHGTPVFPRPFHILAHRCAVGHAFENILVACQNALVLGAVELEFDVQLTRDDEVILFHDETLQKKTGQPGRVRDHTLGELTSMDVKRWFVRTHPQITRAFPSAPLASLRELLATIGLRAYYHIELKSIDEQLPRRVLQEIDRAGVTDRVMLTSFRPAQLERVRTLAPAVPCTLLVPSPRETSAPGGVAVLSAARRAEQRSWIDRGKQIGCTMVGIATRDLTREVVEYAHAHGLYIRAWRVRSDADMNRAITLGTNGMTTDWPDRLIHRQLMYLAGHGAVAADRQTSDR